MALWRGIQSARQNFIFVLLNLYFGAARQAQNMHIAQLTVRANQGSVGVTNNGKSRSQPISGGFQLLIRLENVFLIQPLLKAKQNATVKKIRPGPTFLSNSMYAS